MQRDVDVEAEKMLRESWLKEKFVVFMVLVGAVIVCSGV
jgi:hypothetical protein